MSADYGSRGISRRGILKGATALGAAAMIAPLGATRARAMPITVMVTEAATHYHVVAG